MKKTIKKIRKIHKKHPVKIFALVAILVTASILVYFFGVSPADILKDSLNYMLFALITGTILAGAVHKVLNRRL